MTEVNYNNICYNGCKLTNKKQIVDISFPWHQTWISVIHLLTSVFPFVEFWIFSDKKDNIIYNITYCLQVIQRRLNGKTDFFRGWKEYENDFGDKNAEYWLGNRNLFLNFPPLLSYIFQCLSHIATDFSILWSTYYHSVFFFHFYFIFEIAKYIYLFLFLFLLEYRINAYMKYIECNISSFSTKKQTSKNQTISFFFKNERP